MRVPRVLPAVFLAGALQFGLLLTISPWFWTGAELSRLAWVPAAAATALVAVALPWPRAENQARLVVTTIAFALLLGTWLLLGVAPANGNRAAGDLVSLAMVLSGLAVAAQRLLLVERHAAT